MWGAFSLARYMKIDLSNEIDPKLDMQSFPLSSFGSKFLFYFEGKSTNFISNNTQ